MKVLLFIILVLVCTYAENQITYSAIQHASFVIETEKEVIYVDPTGNIEQYKAFPKPSLILVTDIHRDHLVPDLITELLGDASLVAPKAALKDLNGKALENGDTLSVGSIHIEAIPMYNLSEERSHFHEKGRGNGYVLTVDGKRIYIAGDTEDILEMRALQNIDDAFVCMNLPYTMTVDQAISAVKEFKPRRVFPYHYRGKVNGETVYSDVSRFKEVIEKESNIKVVLLEWY